jgi:hypothetical protein
MKIQKVPTARKVVMVARTPCRLAEPESLAVRYIQNRFDVSLSLARAIATLAQLGGQS